MKHSPGLYVCLARLAARGMFRPERAALAGRLVTPPSEISSVIHFCYNRCGSRYISGLIQELVSCDALQHLDFARFFTHCDIKLMKNLEDPAFVGSAFSPTGAHYGPFYSFFEGLHNLPDCRLILTLRDPRDVLTSRYYSQAFAHTLFDREGIERRQRVQQMGIDAFVIEQVEELEARFLAYSDRLLGKSNVLFLRYEQMVGNFSEWLYQLADFLGVERESPVVQGILDRADFSVNKEDKYSHRRSVQPGNHRKKLLPETVERLNERLRPVLERFGYQVEISDDRL